MAGNLEHLEHLEKPILKISFHHLMGEDGVWRPYRRYSCVRCNLPTASYEGLCNCEKVCGLCTPTPLASVSLSPLATSPS
jgi:hypothetical protein